MMSRKRCLPSNFMNLNPAGFSKSDMSSSWEEVNGRLMSTSDPH
jgi:hypothetical protein